MSNVIEKVKDALHLNKDKDHTTSSTHTTGTHTTGTHNTTTGSGLTGTHGAPHSGVGGGVTGAQHGTPAVGPHDSAMANKAGEFSLFGV